MILDVSVLLGAVIVSVLANNCSFVLKNLLEVVTQCLREEVTIRKDGRETISKMHLRFWRARVLNIVLYGWL